MTPGPCVKRRVRCTIVAADGRAVTGENDCLNSQPVCPREEGEDYTKCTTICQQVGHAEETALDKARAAGLDLTNGVALIAGHWYACTNCQQALRREGVTNILFGIKDL